MKNKYLTPKEFETYLNGLGKLSLRHNSEISVLFENMEKIIQVLKRHDENFKYLAKYLKNRKGKK